MIRREASPRVDETRARPAALPALLFAALLGAACTFTPTTSLRYDPIVVDTHAPLDARLAVLPLEDARGELRYPGYQGRIFMTYIPLLPYVRVAYERLDESYIRHRQEQGSAPDPNDHFPVGMAQEIARDLAQAGLFREVAFVSDPDEARAYDLRLVGTLRSTAFDIYVTSYMLGAPGVLLWILPIPLGKDEATVAIDLELRDRADRALWSHSFSEQSSRLFTMYNSAGPSTSREGRIEIKHYGSNGLGIDGDSFWAYHAEALRGGMGGVKRSLASALPQLRAQ